MVQIHVVPVLDPADIFIWKHFKPDVHVVLIFNPELEHIKLKDADDAHDDLLHSAVNLLEYLNCSFLCNLTDSLHKLLPLHRVNQCNPCEMFRRKGRNSLKTEFLARRAHRISDREDTRVKNTDDVARIRLIHDMPVIRHHLLRLQKSHLLVALHIIDLTVRLKTAGADAHEGKPVPVILVHVCLNLEHKSGKVLLHRIDETLIGHSCQRRHCHFQEVLQERFHSKVSKR